MIRMLLIYMVLFAAAAGALWFGPSENDASAALETPRVVAPVSAPPAAIVAPAPVVSSVATEDVTTLVVRKLQEDAVGTGLAALLENPDGAIDLEPLLDDVPGTVRGADGTRILASALLRRPTPAPRQTASAEPVVEPAPVAVEPAPVPTATQIATAPAPAVSNAPRTSASPAPRPARASLAAVPDLSAQLRDIQTVSAAGTPTTEAVKTYIVQPGDSLGSIAIAHYGSPSAFRTIFEANRDVLPSIDALRVGQQLRLP